MCLCSRLYASCHGRSCNQHIPRYSLVFKCARAPFSTTGLTPSTTSPSSWAWPEVWVGPSPLRQRQGACVSLITLGYLVELLHAHTMIQLSYHYTISMRRWARVPTWGRCSLSCMSARAMPCLISGSQGRRANGEIVPGERRQARLADAAIMLFIHHYRPVYRWLAPETIRVPD